MRTELRSFTDKGRIDVGNDTAARAHLRGGGGKENPRRRAAPLRIARRKVAADIAVGQGAKQRIGDRITQDIGV